MSRFGLKNKETSFGSEQRIMLFLSILILIGLVVLFSASSFVAYQNKNFNNNPYFFLLKQSVFLIIGVFLLLVMRKFDYKKLNTLGFAMMALSTLLLILVLFIGKEINGARRWLNFGLAFQPSEFTEIAIMVFLSSFLSDYEYKRRTNAQLITALSICFIQVILILMQPNFSTAFLICIFIVVMLLMSDINKKIILYLSAPASAFVIFMFFRFQHTVSRLNMFLGRSEVKEQIENSMLAVANGGIMGQGLGLGKFKLLFIPEVYSDYIFTIIAEELGLWGSVLVIAAYLFLFKEGLDISKRTVSQFGKMLAFSISFLIFLKALIHISISVRLMPSTGLVLPFISYGGSGMLMNLVIMGILLNIAKQLPADEKA